MRELRRRGRCWTTSSAGWLSSRRMPRTSHYAGLAPIAWLILLGAGATRVQSERWLLTRFAEHDVAVEIALERSRSGTTWLVGTYTPSRATLHLYGKDLPKSGIHGVARPTLLELVSSASQARGPARSGPTDDRAPSRRPGVDVSRLSGGRRDPPSARHTHLEGQRDGRAIGDVHGV